MAVELNDTHPNLGLVIGEAVVGVTSAPEQWVTVVTSLGKVFELQGRSMVSGHYTAWEWVRLV